MDIKNVNIKAYVLVNNKTGKVSFPQIFETRQAARTLKVSNEKIVQLIPGKFVR